MGTSTRTLLRVAELAAACEISPDTVRYYERAGLLPPPERTAAGYRMYGRTAIDRLKFIRGAQRLGLRLREIADLLAVRDTGECPCEPAEVLLRRRIEELDAEMVRLQALRSELVEMVERIPTGDCPEPTPGRWCPDHENGGDNECCATTPAATTSPVRTRL